MFDHVFPGIQLRLAGPHIEQFNDFGIQTFAVINQRHFVNAADILGRKNGSNFDITEKSDFGFNIFGQKVLRPAQQNVRLNTDFAQRFDAVLRGFGFDFSGGLDERAPRLNE